MREVMKIFSVRLNGDIGLGAAIHEKSLSKKLLQFLRMLFMLLIFIAIAVIANKVGLVLVNMGVGEAIPTICYMIINITSVIITIIKINENITGETDNQYILSLPLGTFTPTLVMFLRMYVINILVASIIAFPMVTPYMSAASLGAGFLRRYILGIIFAPLPASGVASLVGMVLVVILSTSRHNNFINSIISLGMITTFIIIAIKILVDIAKILHGMLPMEASSESIINLITSNYKFAGFFQDGIVDGAWSSVFAYIGVSIIWYIFFLFMLSMMYPELMSALKCPIKPMEYHITDLKVISPAKALFRREFQAYVGSKRYFMTSIMSYLVALILPIAVMIVGQSKVEKIFGLEEIWPSITGNSNLIICILLALGATTYCSYTIEGKRAWISETAPIEEKDIDKAKLFTNLVFSIPTAIISGILFTIAFNNNLVEGIINNIVVSVGYTIFLALYGLVIDKRFKDTTIDSESGAMYTSVSFLLAYLVGVAILVIAMIVKLNLG